MKIWQMRRNCALTPKQLLQFYIVLVCLSFLVAIGFLLSGWTTGFLGLAACLVLSGIGASVQHPLSSSLTSHAFEGSELRGALSTYNLSGDIGKVLLPSLCAALLAIWVPLAF